MISEPAKLIGSVLIAWFISVLVGWGVGVFTKRCFEEFTRKGIYDFPKDKIRRRIIEVAIALFLLSFSFSSLMLTIGVIDFVNRIPLWIINICSLLHVYVFVPILKVIWFYLKESSVVLCWLIFGAIIFLRLLDIYLPKPYYYKRGYHQNKFSFDHLYIMFPIALVMPPIFTVLWVTWLGFTVFVTIHSYTTIPKLVIAIPIIIIALLALLVIFKKQMILQLWKKSYSFRNSLSLMLNQWFRYMNWTSLYSLITCLHSLFEWRIKYFILSMKPKNVRKDGICNFLYDQNILAELSIIDEDEDIRKLALRGLTDQRLLAKVAIKAKYFGEGFNAVHLVTDQELLVKVAMNAKYEFVLEHSLMRVKDQNLLVKVAKNAKNNDIRKRAAKKLKDDKLLMKVLLEVKDHDIQGLAVKNITDVDLLLNTLVYTKDVNVGKAIVENTTSQELLDNILTNRERWVLYSNIVDNDILNAAELNYWRLIGE